jgi:glycosyltransferase involved in cell wall biosynthesis
MGHRLRRAIERGHVRVLHVVDTDQTRGAEIFASDLILALNEAGVTQSVAVLRGTTGPRVSYEAEEFRLQSGRGIRPLHLDPRSILRLRSAIRRWKPDLVQAHGGDSVKHSGLAVGGRIPIVYRWIGVPQGRVASQPRKALYGALLKRSARVVAVAEAVRRELCRMFGFMADRVVTIPNGVDRRRLEPATDPAQMRRELDISPDAPVLLSLAALAWEKDPIGRLNVAARVLRQEPAAVYVMAGAGALRGEIEARVQQNSLGARVRVTGPRADVGDLLNMSDVLLMASRPDGMEGMPGVAIEAGMAGVPVVGYPVAGLPEVVVDGRTGFLVPFQDEEGLAGRVLELMGDEQGRRAMGQEARRVCARFDIREVAPRYLELYEEVTGRVGP